MRKSGTTEDKAAKKADVVGVNPRSKGSAKVADRASGSAGKASGKGAKAKAKATATDKSQKPAKKSAKPKKKKPAVKASLRKLLSFDHDTLFGGGQLAIFASQAKYVIGVDEVGRGCLAGPVVAAAVLLPLENLLRGLEANSLKKRTKDSPPKCPVTRDLKELNDSKVLAPETRQFLSNVIRKNAKFAIAESSVIEIDTINILQASLLAMRRAVMSLCEEHEVDLSEVIMLVDGNRLVHGLPESLCRQLTVIGGDSKSASIAAASVIAKVHRDGFMIEMSKQFPAYKWESNKGYGSRVHRDAIRAEGMTEWHRKSFNVFDDTAYDDLDDEFFDVDAELAERGVDVALGIESGGNGKAAASKRKAVNSNGSKKSPAANASKKSPINAIKQQELSLKV